MCLFLPTYLTVLQLAQISSRGSQHVGQAFWELFEEASAGSRDSCNMLIARQEAFQLQVLRGGGAEQQLVQLELRCVVVVAIGHSNYPFGNQAGWAGQAV